MKRGILLLALAGSCLPACLIFTVPPLRAASMAGTNLVVSIRAEGSAEVGPSSGWSNSATIGGNHGAAVESLIVPVNVRVRLNRTTDCTLSISLTSSPSDTASFSTLNTDGTPIPLSTSAVAVRHYSHSGTYSESIVVTRSQVQSAGSVPLQLRWTLTSSDGAISWTTATAELPAQ